MKSLAFAAGAALLALILAGTSMPRAFAQSIRGNVIFANRCSGCHALDSTREGPALRRVFGRKAGTLPGFPYSDELQASGIVWNDASLDKWLENPGKLVPGNGMEFRVTNKDERAALVAWFKSLGGAR